jgi:hypothetical protein
VEYHTQLPQVGGNEGLGYILGIMIIAVGYNIVKFFEVETTYTEKVDVLTNTRSVRSPLAHLYDKIFVLSLEHCSLHLYSFEVSGVLFLSVCLYIGRRI